MKNRIRRGMTLIEVMIALMVFAIGVLGVLNALTRSIGQSAKTRATLQAQMFAQEGMELIFATRNSNMVGYRQRDCLDTVMGVQSDSVDCVMAMRNVSGSAAVGLSFDPTAGLYGFVGLYDTGFLVNRATYRMTRRRDAGLDTQRLGYTGGVEVGSSAVARMTRFELLTGGRNSGLILTTVSVLTNDAVLSDTRTLQSILGPRE